MRTATRWAALMITAALAGGWATTALAAGARVQAASGAAVALELPPPNGPTEVGEVCMQKVYGAPVTNSNRLGCTAGDIRISKAISVAPNSCTKGTRFNLRGTFETIVTANVRFDAGFFFRVDGGANARGDGAAATGICSLSKPSPGIAPAYNGDGDSCGDLAAGTYQLTFDIPDVACEDDNGDGRLDLPNCTSWHSNQGTACNIDDADTFDPETKSKCNCDDTFSVDVRVENPSITVDKTAAPTQVAETGDAVNFSVNVVNDAVVVSATITSIVDAPFGNLANIPACTGGTATAASPGPCTPATAMTSCPSLIGRVLPPGGGATCSFQVFLSGDAGETLTDTATVCVGSQSGLTDCKSDSASVVVTDVVVAPAVTKTATAASCAIEATYAVVVDNPSLADTLTVNALVDDRFGNITSVHAAGGGFEQVKATTCTAGAGNVIAKGGNYSCTFVGVINSGDCTVNHTNTVTANTTDDDGIGSAPSDSANVSVSSTKN